MDFNKKVLSWVVAAAVLAPCAGFAGSDEDLAAKEAWQQHNREIEASRMRAKEAAKEASKLLSNSVLKVSIDSSVFSTVVDRGTFNQQMVGLTALVLSMKSEIAEISGTDGDEAAFNANVVREIYIKSLLVKKDLDAKAAAVVTVTPSGEGRTDPDKVDLLYQPFAKLQVSARAKTWDEMSEAVQESLSRALDQRYATLQPRIQDLKVPAGARNMAD